MMRPDDAPASAIRGIDHVVLLVRGDHIDAIAKQWTDILGVEFEEMADETLGVRVVINLDAGIELLAPLGSYGSHGAVLEQHLAEHGEGFFSLVVKVDDAEAAGERAVAAGSTVVRRFETSGSEVYAHRYDRFLELALTPIGGINVTVAELRKRKPV